MPFRYLVLPITPEHRLFEKTLERVEVKVKEALTGPVKREVKAAMHKRTTGWKVRPVMTGISQIRKDAFGVLYVFPRGAGREIWVWLTRGVAGHAIVPRVNAHYAQLKVRLNYVPKTTTSGGYGGPGTYGGPTLRASKVDWPGIKSRKFEEKVIEEVQNRVYDIIADAVRRALP